MSKKLIFHPENCIQCHACELACVKWRELEDGVQYRRVSAKFEGAYPMPKLMTRSDACLHCEDPACAATCPVGAITKNEDGIVLVDRDSCIGCRLCYDACPVQVPQFGADGTMQKCDMCIGTDGPYCAAVCPTRAIELVEV